MYKKGRQVNIKFGREICRETSIPAEEGILIAAPYGRTGLKAAEKIQGYFKAKQIKAKVLQDPEYKILLKCKQPVIVIGNLANSRCVEYLYYKFLCITDLSYPGEQGYNLRTILDPFGTGFNILHIGYSDDEGLKNSLNAFVKKIKNTIPYCNDVSYMNLPYYKENIEGIKKATLPDKDDLIPSIHTSFWWLTGFVSYITGDKEPLKTYFEGWRKMIEISKTKPSLIRSAHLHMTQHIENWRLLEYSGMIPDDLRAQIEKCIFDWATSSEGKEYAKSNTGGKIIPSHNHSMFCALSLCYASDYFAKHYPQLKITEEWKKVARDAFYTFNNGGWKPFCDDSYYSVQISLCLVSLYSIFKNDHIFLNTSGKKVVQWIKTVIGQNACMPSFGDGTVKNPFPYSIVMLLAHYYKDGELRYLRERLGNKRTLDIGRQRLFDSGVKPKKITDSTSISHIELDKYIYDIWNKDPYVGRRLTATPPKGPYEKCFDKVSVRTGWDKIKDDFLLIDGLGSNGVHAYKDAMGILDYTSKGIVWLVEENCYRWPEPENCSILTISRDGYTSDVPGYALMEEQKKINNDQFYLRLRSKDYNKTDWVREIYLIKGLCVIFHDTVIPNEKGHYIIGAHFRTPGKARIDKNTMKSKRKNQKGDTYELRLSSYGFEDINTKFREIPFGEKLFSYGGMYEENQVLNFTSFAKNDVFWENRYNTKDIVISSMSSYASTYLKEGKKVSLTHIVHPAKPNDGNISTKICDNKIFLEYENKSYEFPVKHTGIKKDDKPGKPDNKLEVNEMNLGKVITFDKKINNIVNIDENINLCSLQNGKLVMFKDEQIIWSNTVKGEIHVIEYIESDKIIVLGHGNNMISAMDLKGNIKWTTNSKRIPTVHSSWEYAHPRIVSINRFKSDNGTVIVAGCGDNQVRMYNTCGKMINVFNVYATVPDIIEIMDIDKDGELEILAAGKKESSAGTFHIYNTKGKPKKNITVGGWLCNIKSHQIFSKDNVYTFVCGMNYSKNFKIFNYEKEKIKYIAEKSLGGTVNSILLDKDNNRIYAGTSEGAILAFNTDGEDLWYANVNTGIKKLLHFDDNIIAVCDQNIYTVNSSGKIEFNMSLPKKYESCIKTDDKIYMCCGNTVYTL